MSGGETKDGRATQDAVERVILRRLHEKRIEGYTLEMAEEIAAILSPSVLLAAALKRLTFLARTSGGWKRDEALCAACDEAERLLSPGLISRSKEWWLARADAEGDHVIAAGAPGVTPDS
jgi:hypothetical protein